jgi:hypothetical protein
MGTDGNSDTVSSWSHRTEREEREREMAARRSPPVPDQNRGGALELTGVSYAGGVRPSGGV